MRRRAASREVYCLDTGTFHCSPAGVGSDYCRLLYELESEGISRRSAYVKVSQDPSVTQRHQINHPDGVLSVHGENFIVKIRN